MELKQREHAGVKTVQPKRSVDFPGRSCLVRLFSYA